MSGTDQLEYSIPSCAAHNQGCKMAAMGALGKDSIGQFDHLVERSIRGCEAPKRSMKMTHEQRSGQSFPGDIPKQKEQTAVAFDDVAVIAADDSGRRIVIPNLVPTKTARWAG